MKVLVVCCFAVVWLQYVAAQNEADQAEVYELKFKEKSVSEGENDFPELPEGVFLLHQEDVIHQGIPKEVVVSKVEYREPNVEIYGIKATPLDADTEKSIDELIEGGVKQNFAVIHVTSQPGKGNYFSVEIYGKYVNADTAAAGTTQGAETASMIV